MNTFAFIGGIWLSLLYSAMVMPASVWSVQLTVSRSWQSGFTASLGLAFGQLPWVLFASLILFQNARAWQNIDLPLRFAGAAFLIWMTYRCFGSGQVLSLKAKAPAQLQTIFHVAFWRSFAMPWRLALWAVLIISIGIHLRGPGWHAALAFTAGSFFGQLLWLLHFAFLAAIFGHRVAEAVSIRSLNKLRLLATTVSFGLALIILAPVAFPPA